jgi:hypothetical protein
MEWREAMRDSGEQAVYRIKVRGALDEQWSDWFDGLTVTVESDRGGGHPPVTSITGAIDQATLRGILNQVWDLNLALISVAPIEMNGPFEEVCDDD